MISFILLIFLISKFYKIQKKVILPMKIKLHQSKERNTIAKASQFSSLNSSMIKITKQDSKHTKVSTNMTSTSLHINAATKKSIKQAKPQAQQKPKKQKTIREKQLVTSGRGQTLKTKMKNKKSLDFQFQKMCQPMEQGAISVRQYCLVQNAFVPIVSKVQHQKLEDIMRSTADTTNRFDDFNRATFRNKFPFKLRDNNHSEIHQTQNDENIFAKVKKVSKREVEISASPFYEEVGIQYSERPQVVQQPKQQIKPVQLVKGVEIDIQTQPIEEQPQDQASPFKAINHFLTQDNEEEQCLSDLLLKLQFKHLPDAKVFQNLSSNEKQHYSQVLHCLIAKLSCSPREKTESVHVKSKEMIEIEQVQIVPLQEIKIKYEKLQMQILKRQSYQMNWMQRRGGCDDDGGFDTSLMTINGFLLNFFCYIELNYLEQFLSNIRKQYGPGYVSQYQRVTNTSPKPHQSTKVLPCHIFSDFCQQISNVTPLQQYHLQAIFDHINQLLDTYRPYYQHSGEPFPWALIGHNNICEFVIDESSLEIIFIQIKENMEKAAAMLCGIIVDEELVKGISEVNPLAIKRGQREDVMVNQWMKEKTDDNHRVECEATNVMFEVGEEVYQIMLQEVIRQLASLDQAIHA